MAEIEDIISSVKDLWPQFCISQENLLHPTKEFVYMFYSNFINELNSKMSYLMNMSSSSTLSDINPCHYEPEERLFEQLSEVFEKINCLKFTLLDIYKPVPSRTKIFFKICTHFTIYTDSLLNEVFELGNIVPKTEENLCNLKEEQQQLLTKINENAKLIAEYPLINKTILEEYKNVRNSYKEMMGIKANKEDKHTQEKRQMESFRREILDMEYELEHLKSKEKKLLDKKITESGYQQMLQTIETLRSETATLDSHDVSMENLLTSENESLNHIAHCKRILNKYEYNDENVKKLIHDEEELAVLMCDLEKFCSNRSILQHKIYESEKMLLSIKQSMSNLQVEHKNLGEEYVKYFEQYSYNLNKYAEKMRKKVENYEIIITNYKKNNSKLEDDMDSLRNTFQALYIKISKTEHRVVEDFKETLLKLNKLN